MGIVLSGRRSDYDGPIRGAIRRALTQTEFTPISPHGKHAGRPLLLLLPSGLDGWGFPDVLQVVIAPETDAESVLANDWWNWERSLADMLL
jgi:hypothetical protein